MATRDLLAQRMLRLERRLAGVSEQIDATRTQLERVLGELDALARLVGRLGRVVDVQGDTLQSDEDALLRKVGRLEDRLQDLEAAVPSRPRHTSRPKTETSVLSVARATKRSARVKAARGRRS